ncbi:RidA family protein [Flagellimonas lutimaris]|uniref:RidA family protein n=1 Tax=Flagellimonas lutimaris TaxID=475082 RepID=UPI003F5CCC98
MDIEKILTKNRLTLPGLSNPGGEYISVNVRHKIIYVAIQFPIFNDRFLYQGRLVDTITTEDGHRATELCALNILSQIHHKIGFENVLGLNHLDMYYRSTEDWDDAPKIFDGASGLFAKVLGDKGLHSRSIFGVNKLPKNFCVGITSSFTLV